MNAEALEAARAVAFRFLGYSDRSEAEMIRRLERDGFDAAVISAVLQELANQGWVNDTQFAARWVEDRADRKRYGRTRLSAELRRKGVAQETIEEAVGRVGDAEEKERALKAVRAKVRPEALSSPDRAVQQSERRRLASLLQRRGFSWEIIVQVIAELAQNTEELSD